MCLLQGMESKERVAALLSLTSIKSEPVTAAIYSHLTDGFSDTDSAALHDVKKSSFSRALSALNDVADKVEKIKEIDFAHLNKHK